MCSSGLEIAIYLSRAVILYETSRREILQYIYTQIIIIIYRIRDFLRFHSSFRTHTHIRIVVVVVITCSRPRKFVRLELDLVPGVVKPAVAAV